MHLRCMELEKRFEWAYIAASYSYEGKECSYMSLWHQLCDVHIALCGGVNGPRDYAALGHSYRENVKWWRERELISDEQPGFDDRVARKITDYGETSGT